MPQSKKPTKGDLFAAEKAKEGVKQPKRVLPKVGRPTLYEEAFCDQLIEHMAQGYSFKSFAGVVGVSFATLDVWEAAHQEFLEAHTTGESLSRIWWEKVGHTGMVGKIGGFRENMWKYNIGNKWPKDFKERREVTGADGAPLMPASTTKADIENQVEQMLADIQKRKNDRQG